MQLLPQALRLRGPDPAVRPPVGRRRDAARAQAEARGAADASLASRSRPGSAGRAGRARDHDQASRVAAPGQRADGAAAELGRKPAGQRLSAGLEVDDRLLVAEAVRLRDVADAIAE